MKIVFAGTPEFARTALAALLQEVQAMQGQQEPTWQISLVLTQPDRPAGRGMKLQASPVKKLALSQGIRVSQPLKMADLSSEDRRTIADADMMVVAAYGLILPQWVLDLPRLGCINIHASLLPRWRGAAPIHRAIEAGDHETGVCIMQMEAGLDTGPVLLREGLAIGSSDTTASLHDKLAHLGARLCVLALRNFSALRPQPQASEGVTYAHKISKAESALDWRGNAEVLARKIRAFNPFPGCSAVCAGETIKIWGAQALLPAQAVAPDGEGADAGRVVAIHQEGIDVACGSGVLRLSQLQRAGGKRLSAADFCRGFALEVGMRFEVGSLGEGREQ